VDEFASQMVEEKRCKTKELWPRKNHMPTHLYPKIKKTRFRKKKEIVPGNSVEAEA
jgi:hypothetical protein